MSANDIEATGLAMPRLDSVRAGTPHKVVVRWSAGSHANISEEIDLAPIINTYRIFRPLRNNDALFRTVRVIDDGNAIGWDGDDLELSADALEALAEQTMTPAAFAAFMKRFRLTETAIAAILGYSRRQIGYFKTTGPIPRVVALACKGYEFEQIEKAELTGDGPRRLRKSNETAA